MTEMARLSDRTFSRSLAWTVAAAVAAVLAGCGDSDTIDAARTMTFYPVKGKVILPDGKPFAAGKVVFAGKVTNTATTESDGSFEFKGTKDGLPDGEYKVRLETGEAGASAGKKKKGTLPFASKYLDEDTSGLTATVKPDGANDFEFKLTAK